MESETFEKIELKLQGNINTLYPTRVDASGFELDDVVGVYISNQDKLNSSNNWVDNNAYINRGNTIVAPTNKEVYWQSENARFSIWAYYPYINDITNSKTIDFCVSANQTTAQAYYDSDFIAVKKLNIAPQTTPVDLTFDHMLSKIAITLVAGENISEEELMEATKSLCIENVAIDGTINLETLTATAGPTIATITPHQEDDLSFSAILFPQKSKVTFKMEIDGETYFYTTTMDFRPKYQHNIEFTVNKWIPLQMQLSALKIGNWTFGGNKKEQLACLVQFKDPKLKEYLVNYSFTNSEYDYDECGWVTTTIILDANQDGEIDHKEAEILTEIDLSNLGLPDLDGIEYFSNLTSLDCSNNYIKTLDLSKNTKLTSLSCSDNPLTSLDISNCSALKTLNCSNNQLSSLDISNNKKLTKLTCVGNQLSDLNISNNTELTELVCYNNQLTSLNVHNCSSLTTLVCDNNSITSLDFSNCASLVDINCFSNQLTSLNISDCTKLIHLDCSYNFSLTYLDISNNTKLTEFNCRHNQLSSLDVSNCTSLKNLDCGYNQLSSLNISNNLKLEGFWCDGNVLTSLEVSNNTELTEFVCNINKLSSLDVSNNTKLTMLGCDYNQLSSLDVFNCTSLTYLYCNNNQITSIDIANNTQLTEFSCSSNQLNYLDASNCSSLTYLICDNNKLTSLDASNNTGLTYLDCGYNQLTSLNVSNNTKLTYLQCGYNQLTSIDTSNCKSLSGFYCSCNKLTSLDVSNNKELTYLDCDPMNDDDGHNMLKTIYTAKWQNIKFLYKPDTTEIIYK